MCQCNVCHFNASWCWCYFHCSFQSVCQLPNSVLVLPLVCLNFPGWLIIAGLPYVDRINLSTVMVFIGRWQLYLFPILTLVYSFSGCSFSVPVRVLLVLTASCACITMDHCVAASCSVCLVLLFWYIVCDPLMCYAL